MFEEMSSHCQTKLLEKSVNHREVMQDLGGPIFPEDLIDQKSVQNIISHLVDLRLYSKSVVAASKKRTELRASSVYILPLVLTLLFAVRSRTAGSVMAAIWRTP